MSDDRLSQQVVPAIQALRHRVHQVGDPLGQGLLELAFLSGLMRALHNLSDFVPQVAVHQYHVLVYHELLCLEFDLDGFKHLNCLQDVFEALSVE